MTEDIVTFKRPPITEAVFHVSFDPIDGFGSPDIGLFWSTLRDEFPTVSLAPRLGTFGLDGPVGIFPENRVWLVHRDSGELLQVQDDRFLFNWRKIGADANYPTFRRLYPIFKDYFQRFVRFLEQEEYGQVSLTGFELHYVNRIPKGDLWEAWSELGNVVPMLDWRRNTVQIPGLSAVKLHTEAAIPDSPDRLIVSVDTRRNRETEQELINIEVRVTGRREDLAIDSLDSVFEPAHLIVVNSFMAITSAQAQSFWGRE